MSLTAGGAMGSTESSTVKSIVASSASVFGDLCVKFFEFLRNLPELLPEFLDHLREWTFQRPAFTAELANFCIPVMKYEEAT
jgi:hypothetical protein